MRALITGIAGFAGTYLAEHLHAAGVEVLGIVRPGGAPRVSQSVARFAHIYEADLLNREAVRTALESSRPDQIYHLAARAEVSRSWDDPIGVLRNNILAQAILLETLVELKLAPAVLIIGSSEEYGALGADESAVTEEHPLRPDSPYALSKVTQDLMGLQYYVARQIPCVRLRPFNQLGPRQTDDFVVPAFARQIAEIEAGLREPVVRVGNLESARDFTDVRDMAVAYRIALERGDPGEVYNVGSGKAVRISAILNFFVERSRVPARVEVDPSRFRPSDSPIKLSDPSRFIAKTGWQPTIPLEQTLVEVLEYWREAVANKPRHES